MDPISILTATSFGIQALEFLIGAGFDIYEMSQEARDCQTTLRVYAYKLAGCQSRLEGWKMVWKGFKSETYKHFWGESAYGMIQRIFDDINDLSVGIRKQIEGADAKEPKQTSPSSTEEQAHWGRRLFRILKDKDRKQKSADPKQSPELKSVDLSEEDAKEWQQAVAFAKKGSFALFPTSNPSIFYRIAFSLILSTKLEARLERLENLIEQLDTYTMSEYRRMRMTEMKMTEPVTHTELQDTKKRKHLADNFDSFINELHVACKKLGQQSRWSVELRVPDERGNSSSLNTTYAVDIDFTLSVEGQTTPGEWYRVRIPYTDMLNPQEIAATLPGLITATVADGESDHKKSYIVLEQAERRSLAFRPLLMTGIFERPVTSKASEEDRANLVFSLANWVILLWNSPWTTVPCCCGIRFLKVAGKKKQDDNGAAEKRQYTLAAEQHNDCRNPLLADYKVLLLGIALAEVIIGTPLRIPFDPKPGIPTRSDWQVLIIEKWRADLEPPRWEASSRYQILAEVRNKSMKDGAMKVIEYCFDNPLISESSTLSPDEIALLVEHILQPLQEFHTVIIEQRQKSADRPWWRGFLAWADSTDVPWPDEAVFED